MMIGLVSFVIREEKQDTILTKRIENKLKTVSIRGGKLVSQGSPRTTYTAGGTAKYTKQCDRFGG